MTPRYPRYGAQQIWTWVKLRGHVLPVVAADDQYCVLLPDGTRLYVEKWDCDSAFPQYVTPKAEMREREARRLAQGFTRNKATPEIEIEAAFRRCEGKFED